MAVRKNSKSKASTNASAPRGKPKPARKPSPKLAVAHVRKDDWDAPVVLRPDSNQNSNQNSNPAEPASPAPAAPPVDEPAPLPRDRGSYDGDTAFKLYLREIGQVKLLTPQEEIELAARIKKGDKKAREQMIKANLRLVVKIAHDYR